MTLASYGIVDAEKPVTGRSAVAQVTKGRRLAVFRRIDGNCSTRLYR